MTEKRITIPLPKSTHDKLRRIGKRKGTSKLWEAKNILVLAVENEPEPQKA